MSLFHTFQQKTRNLLRETVSFFFFPTIYQHLFPAAGHFRNPIPWDRTQGTAGSFSTALFWENAGRWSGSIDALVHFGEEAVPCRATLLGITFSPGPSLGSPLSSPSDTVTSVTLKSHPQHCEKCFPSWVNTSKNSWVNSPRCDWKGTLKKDRLRLSLRRERTGIWRWFVAGCLTTQIRNKLGLQQPRGFEARDGNACGSVIF